VRWYLRYSLSYRDLEELMRERGLSVDHTTIFRWVQRFSPELEKRCRPYLRSTSDSYRVDETYVKIKGKWYYLFRAVDSKGQTIDFLLSCLYRKFHPRTSGQNLTWSMNSILTRLSSVPTNATLRF